MTMHATTMARYTSFSVVAPVHLMSLGSKVLTLLAYVTVAVVSIQSLIFLHGHYVSQVEKEVLRDVVQGDGMNPYTLRPSLDIDRINGYLLDNISLDCDGLKRHDPKTIEGLINWDYPYNVLEKQLFEAKDTCATIKRLYYFPSKPYSKEEEEYTLAYGALIYRRPSQVLFMLSSFYHPQNDYCLAISDGAKPEFKTLFKNVAECFPNIHILWRPKITWGSFEIINSTYACMEHLMEHGRDWKYFQYLAGVDLPLRTNWEMTKVLKALNETINCEIKSFQPPRLKSKNASEIPLRFFKSSLSATFPRAAADYLHKSPLTKKLLTFLQGTVIPDEAFWGTVSGSNDLFPIPGGFNGTEYIIFKKVHGPDCRKEIRQKNETVRMRSYISRYQVWHGNCGGKLAADSCVYGVEHYHKLMLAPQLVAHKLYIEYQPAAFFCLLKEIRHRTENPLKDFDLDKKYAELPQVERKRGIPLENISHPTWIF